MVKVVKWWHQEKTVWIKSSSMFELFSFIFYWTNERASSIILLQFQSVPMSPSPSSSSKILEKRLSRLSIFQRMIYDVIFLWRCKLVHFNPFRVFFIFGFLCHMLLKKKDIDYIMNHFLTLYKGSWRLEKI